MIAFRPRRRQLRRTAPASTALLSGGGAALARTAPAAEQIVVKQGAFDRVAGFPGELTVMAIEIGGPSFWRHR